MTQHFHFSFPVEEEVHSSISGGDTALCVYLCVCLLSITAAGESDRKWPAEERHVGGVGRPEPGGGGFL